MDVKNIGPENANENGFKTSLALDSENVRRKLMRDKSLTYLALKLVLTLTGLLPQTNANLKKISHKFIDL